MGSSLQRCSNRNPWILQAPRAQCLQCSQTHNAHKRTILTTLTKLTTLIITTKSSQSSVCNLQWSVQWRSRVRFSAPERPVSPNPDRFRAAGEPRASRLAIAEPPIAFNPTTFREEQKNKGLRRTQPSSFIWIFGATSWYATKVKSLLPLLDALEDVRL